MDNGCSREVSRTHTTELAVQFRTYRLRTFVINTVQTAMILFLVNLEKQPNLLLLEIERKREKMLVKFRMGEIALKPKK